MDEWRAKQQKSNDEWQQQQQVAQQQAGANVQAVPGNAPQAWARLQAYKAQQQLRARQILVTKQARRSKLAQPKPVAPVTVQTAPSKPPTPPPPPMTPDELATSKFNMAMMLAKAGKLDTAEEYCHFVLKTYPGTAGAAQAQAYLDKAFEQ
jgi:hypothetical protein